MANNINGGAPNAVVAKASTSFATAGITADNTEIIYLVDDPLQSFVPGRAINGISGFVSGKGYYMVAKIDMDLSGVVVPPLTGESQLAAPGSFTATPSGSTEIDLAWSAVSGATNYIIDRATNVGFTAGVTSGIYSGSGTSFNDTGRTASTQYFYRIRATGSGHVDSDYSIANATTGSGTSLLDISIASASGSISESPAHTFNLDGGDYFIANETLPASTDGYIIQDVVVAPTGEGIAFGVDSDPTLNYFITDTTINWLAIGFVLTGTYWYSSSADGTIDSGIAYATNDKFRVRRAGTALSMEKSSDGGTTWTHVATYATTSAAKLYVKVAHSSGFDPTILKNPKGLNIS